MNCRILTVGLLTAVTACSTSPGPEQAAPTPPTPATAITDATPVSDATPPPPSAVTPVDPHASPVATAPGSAESPMVTDPPHDPNLKFPTRSGTAFAGGWDQTTENLAATVREVGMELAPPETVLELFGMSGMTWPAEGRAYAAELTLVPPVGGDPAAGLMRSDLVAFMYAPTTPTVDTEIDLVAREFLDPLGGTWERDRVTAPGDDPDCASDTAVSNWVQSIEVCVESGGDYAGHAIIALSRNGAATAPGSTRDQLGNLAEIIPPGTITRFELRWAADEQNPDAASVTANATIVNSDWEPTSAFTDGGSRRWWTDDGVMVVVEDNELSWKFTGRLEDLLQ